jgi:heme/copper-type cytochrome/quinol oxidase subunit 2
LIFIFTLILQILIADEIDFNFDFVGLVPNIERFWSFGPLLLLIVLSLPSIIFTYDLDVSTLDYIFKLYRNQWFWRLEFLDFIIESKLTRNRISRTNGTRNFNILNGSIIRVSVCSQDVLHSFCIPSFNIHVDATPRRSIILKINPYLTGNYLATCQELCRHRHSRITLNLSVIEI